MQNHKNYKLPSKSLELCKKAIKNHKYKLQTKKLEIFYKKNYEGSLFKMLFSKKIFLNKELKEKLLNYIHK